MSRSQWLRRQRSRLLTARERFTVRAGHGDTESPVPGALLVISEAGEYPELWAVVDESNGRCLLLPADLDPFVGTGDVAIPAGGASGAVTVRCRFPVHLPIAALANSRPAACLEQESLDRVRQTLADLERGRANTDDARRETDEEPGYRNLERKLGKACERLVAAEAAKERTSVPTPRRAWQPAAGMAMAACLALIAAFLVGRQTGPSGSPPPSGNGARQLAYQWLNPAETERAGTPAPSLRILDLEAKGSFALVLALDGGLAPGAYRLEILDEAEQPVASSDVEVRAGDTELAIVLESDRLVAGGYRLELTATATSIPAAIYRFRILTASED